MGKSQETFGKKDREKKRLKKREEKQRKKEERKASNAESGSGLDSMMAYVNHNGEIVDTPPDPMDKVEVEAEDIVIGIPKKEKEDVSGLRTGKVSFFNDAKGYGFIKETGSQESYFVHVNGLLEEIQETDKVQFELEPGPKGMVAVKVQRI